MRIGNTSRIITLAIFLLAGLSAFATLNSFSLLEQRRQTTNILLTALKASTQFLAGSDLLTSSVRAYAATGDQQYWYDYQNELSVTRSRDHALRILVNLPLKEQELGGFVEGKNNSDGLVNLENEAAAAAASGNLKKAVALVYGPEYAHEKASIVEPVNAAIREVDQRLTLQRQALTTQAVTLTATFLTVLAIFGSFILFFQRRVVLPLAELTRKTQRILAGDKGIRFGRGPGPAEVGELASAPEGSSPVPGGPLGPGHHHHRQDRPPPRHREGRDPRPHPFEARKTGTRGIRSDEDPCPARLGGPGPRGTPPRNPRWIS